MLNKVETMTDEQKNTFSKKFGLDVKILNKTYDYFVPEKERQVYDWCREINRGKF
jgi:hypothetical protein